MASGKQHDRITLWGLPLVMVVGLRCTLNGWLTFTLCLAYLIGGWMLGPDLDIHSRQTKRWGPLYPLWTPYQKLVGRHRSFLSHGPIIGTVIRILYLLTWVAALFIIGVESLRVLTDYDPNMLELARRFSKLIPWPHAAAAAAGLEIGAFSHYTADWISSRLKTVNKKTLCKTKKRKRRRSRTPKSLPSRGRR